MEYLAIFLIILILGYFTIFKTQVKIRQTNEKKEDIIQNYHNDLQKILAQHQNDKTIQREQKARFLKQCNDELSRNIFFTPDESKKILQNLAKL